MKQLIDKSDLIAEIEKRLEAIANASPEDNKQFAAIRGAQHYELISLVRFINTLETKEVDLEKERFYLQQKNPEPYFYCKYGDTMPLCSDCKRNHNNSSFKTEEITTWYSPSNGTKHCIDYIQQEHSKVDLEKALSDLDKDMKEFVTTEEFERESETCGHYWAIAKHAFLLGLKTQKGE